MKAKEKTNLGLSRFELISEVNKAIGGGVLVTEQGDNPIVQISTTREVIDRLLQMDGIEELPYAFKNRPEDSSISCPEIRIPWNQRNSGGACWYPGCGS
ncbi:MAG: hypothetical protein K9M03_04855 [Kiritimatiellales bacterium]|nr:hypothetical protein [Kiritimatiellales bacterium]